MANNIPSSISLSDFPSDVFKWMKINAKPKMALKLMQCCKYFQHHEFPYFVSKNVKFFGDTLRIIFLNGKSFDCQGLDYIKNITMKFWLIGDLHINLVPNIGDTFLQKIAVCDITSLRIENESLLFEEFRYLTSAGKIKELYFENVAIIFENGDPVFIAEILKCIPNVENFYFYNNEIPVFSSDFMETMKEINVSKVKDFGLHINSYSKFLIFVNFMNQNPHIKYRIYFIDNALIHEEALKVKEYVQGIIDAGLTEFPPPDIQFHGQSFEQLEALYSLSDQYNLKNERK